MTTQTCHNAIVTCALALFGTSAFAGPTPLSANVGWVADTLSTAGAATDGSPFTFSLVANKVASFKVTDQFATGDSFDLYVNGGALIALSSTAFVGSANAIVGDPFGESGWLSNSYEKFDYIFSTAGDYSFVVKGDGIGGIPAGLYFRLDVTDSSTVPEPTSLALLALALCGLGVTARRRNNA